MLLQFDVDGDIAALESGTLARINVSGRQLTPNDCKILTSILHRPAVASRLAILDLRFAFFAFPCIVSQRFRTRVGEWGNGSKTR